jgi:mono/diheme cytochrome c family protein
MNMVRVLSATLLLAAVAAALFVESGFYNIGADDHHTAVTLAVIEKLRDRSIEARARSIDARLVSDPQEIAAGAEHYAALCAGCHLAPGVTKSAVRAGLYPHPPNLAQQDPPDPRRAFWVIKHGIKMSAMPAWEKSLDDAAIWEVVSFVRSMPAMTPETYREISRPQPPGRNGNS